MTSKLPRAAITRVKVAREKMLGSPSNLQSTDDITGCAPTDTLDGRPYDPRAYLDMLTEEQGVDPALAMRIASRVFDHSEVGEARTGPPEPPTFDDPHKIGELLLARFDPRY